MTSPCWVTIILVLWCSAPPTQARAAATGELGRLAAGIRAFEEKRYTAAISALAGLEEGLPKLADYAAYYRTAARVESGDGTVSGADLAATRRGPVASPLAARAWVVEARARVAAGTPWDGVRLLNEHAAGLPQPDGDLALAAAYQAAGDLVRAAECYQRVYHQHPRAAGAARASAALAALKQRMGSAYPRPSARQALERAGRLLEAGSYREARAEYAALAERAAGTESALARLRVGAADYRAGRTHAACAYFRSLEARGPEAGAERLYYLAECARGARDDRSLLAALGDLERTSARSPWRLKALTAAAGRFLAANQPEQYLPLYRAIYEGFRDDPAAGPAHWRVAFDAYRRRAPEAADLLRRHLLFYTAQPTAAGALYFMGRLEESRGDAGAARAAYDKLVALYPNYYYGMLARARLAEAAVAAAHASADMTWFLAGVAFPARVRPELAPTAATELRAERARLLGEAGLGELATAELRFGVTADARPALLAMELARQAGAVHQGLRAMKRYGGDYLSLRLDEASAEFWKLLFPLPWRDPIAREAAAHRLDLFLVAALIRQESEFDPGAVSRARAYGLMQIRPATARAYANRAGVGRLSTAALKQPTTNLMLGMAIFRSMLDAVDGRLEPALAAYNAGPSRADRWSAWHNYAEPAEFVESIPFTETREYVQAVLRNAEVYRRLYAGGAPPPEPGK
jgi:soluble lytic murein transglycosylase